MKVDLEKVTKILRDEINASKSEAARLKKLGRTDARVYEIACFMMQKALAKVQRIAE